MGFSGSFDWKVIWVMLDHWSWSGSSQRNVLSENRTSVCDVVLCLHALFLLLLLFFVFFVVFCFFGGVGGREDDWSLRMSIPKYFSLVWLVLRIIYFFLSKFVNWRPCKKWLRPFSENNNSKTKRQKIYIKLNCKELLVLSTFHFTFFRGGIRSEVYIGKDGT